MQQYVFIFTLIIITLFCRSSPASAAKDLLDAIKEDLRRNNDDYLEARSSLAMLLPVTTKSKLPAPTIKEFPRNLNGEPFALRRKGNEIGDKVDISNSRSISTKSTLAPLSDESKSSSRAGILTPLRKKVVKDAYSAATSNKVATAGKNDLAIMRKKSFNVKTTTTKDFKTYKAVKSNSLETIESLEEEQTNADVKTTITTQKSSTKDGERAAWSGRPKDPDPVMRAQGFLEVNKLQRQEKTNRAEKKSQESLEILRQNLVEDLPAFRAMPAELMDMAPARGARIHNMRLKNRLCQRSVLFPEGPKYDSHGKVYVRRFTPHGKTRFERTNAPRLLLPRCCNCCHKSVLGCE